MKKLKKIWQENSVLFVLLFILIACLVAICVVVVTYFVGDSSSKYGDRLEGIKDYPFDEDTQNEIISQIKEEKIVEDVTMRISGKIIYITITFVPETTLVEGQSVALSSLDYFSEETLSFYDLEYMIEADSTEETECSHTDFLPKNIFFSAEYFRLYRKQSILFSQAPSSLHWDFSILVLEQGMAYALLDELVAQNNHQGLSFYLANSSKQLEILCHFRLFGCMLFLRR